MGFMIKDSTTLEIIVQLNKRFDKDSIAEMVALQKEFKIFATGHDLKQSFAVLGIVPADLSERNRWYKFLDYLKTYPSDLTKVNGHDRVVKAFKDTLAATPAMPLSIICHPAKEDPRVVVSKGRPVIYSTDTHVLISIPTTPSKEVRQKAANMAKARRAAKSKK
jgi:hypothetical protein